MIVIAIFNYIIYKTQSQEYSSFTNKILMLLEFWYPMIIMAFVFSGREKIGIKQKKLIINFFIMIYTIISLTTIIGNLNYDIPSRYLATSTLDSELVVLYKSSNIGGFGFCYMAIFVVPMLIYMYKNTKNKIYIIPLVITYIMCIESQYTILIFLVALVTIITYFDNFSMRKKLIVVSIFTLLFILLIINLKEILLWIINIFSEQESVQKRLYEIYNLINDKRITADSTDLSSRQDLYQKSWESFASSPIIGNYKLGIGEHSEFLDLLGSMGVVGLMLLLVIFGILFRILSKSIYLLSNIGKYHIKIAIVLMFILSILNPIFSSKELGFVGLFVMLYTTSCDGDFIKNINGEEVHI